MSSPKNNSLINQGYQLQRLQSLQKNEYDFLTRKINRLEEDYHQVCDELQKTRNRLRKAEDYEIKYELIAKQKLGLQSELLIKENLLAKHSIQIKQMEMIFTESKNIELGLKVERDNIQRQAEQWRARYLQSQEVASKIKADQEYKMNQRLTIQLDLLKKLFSGQQEEYKNKIRILEISLSQKESMESVMKQKNERNSSNKQNQIERLQQALSKLRSEHIIFSQQKNKQIINTANKFQKIFNFEIQKLKGIQSQNSDKFSVQVESLRGLLELKNNQIDSLIQQINENRANFLIQKDQLLKEIRILKQKVYQRERQNQLQLYNLKERLIAIHKSDSQNMKANFQIINIKLQQNVIDLQKIIKFRQKQISELKQNFEQKKSELRDQIQSKNIAISQLQQQIRHLTDLNAKEIDNMQESFHKITTQKGLLSTQYQTTFDFFNNQISKLTSSNELKNQQIKDLHSQISESKKNFSQHIKSLQKKWRQQRKDRQQQRDKQRELREKLQDEFRQKEQKWRHRQRVLQRDKQKQQRERIKQKVAIQQLQKNIERLTKHVKQNQHRLKDQMQKNQSNFIETGTMRRQLTGELERQKSQMQAIKKLQFDQVHRQYEIQITRLTNENQRFLNQLTQLKLNFDRLDEQYKKLKNTNKNIDRINKQKAIQYQKKMATLNAQINITQNLYNSFINAKSKIIKKGPQN